MPMTATMAKVAPVLGPTAPMSKPVGGPVGAAVSSTIRPRPHLAASPADRHDARSFPVRGLNRSIRVKIASKRDEFEQAYRLVADRYKAKGYEAADSGPYRYTPHHALPGTVTLVAKDGDRVVATLSMVPDNDVLGLPMESIYGEEIAALRQEGRSMGEVICLAEEGLTFREFLEVFTALIRLVCQYHVRQGGDSWVITVNPHHSAFYKRALGFVSIGPCRSYSAVGNHPAEAYLLDVALMRENAPKKHEEIFGEGLPRSVLTPVQWPADYAADFGAGASGWEGEEDETEEEEAEVCGSWHSRRCSPIGVGS